MDRIDHFLDIIVNSNYISIEFYKVDSKYIFKKKKNIFANI